MVNKSAPIFLSIVTPERTNLIAIRGDLFHKPQSMNLESSMEQETYWPRTQKNPTAKVIGQCYFGCWRPFPAEQLLLRNYNIFA